MKIFDKQGSLIVAYGLHANEHEAGGSDELSLGAIAGEITDAQHGSAVKCGGDFSSKSLTIECRIDDPVGPEDGRIWLRTDL